MVSIWRSIWWPIGTAPQRRLGWPGPWSSTPVETDAQQDSAMLRHRAHLSDVAHRAQDLIDSRFTDRLPLAALAAAAAVSARTLTREFGRAVGMTPLRYQQLLRTERAEHLIGHGETVEAAARAVGFEDARMLRRLRSTRNAPSEIGVRAPPAGARRAITPC